MKLFLVIFWNEKILLAAETEQDARILAAHCIGKNVKTVKSVFYLGETDKPLFKTKR